MEVFRSCQYVYPGGKIYQRRNHNRYEKYYLENTELAHGIIVDENRKIRDGYIAYLLSEKYGCKVDIMEVPKESPVAKLVIGHHVEYDTEQKIYVMKNGKRYAWVYTIREAVVSGDILFVKTSKGNAYMQVEKITNIAGKRTIRRYKKVKKNITAENLLKILRKILHIRRALNILIVYK